MPSSIYSRQQESGDGKEAGVVLEKKSRRVTCELDSFNDCINDEWKISLFIVVLEAVFFF